ncbi:MAG: BrnA antitoxin family protein, partial [Bradyrhizobium sp.]|nr:BrnA antitoxin family protein [Bradyrhizobium sp.]
LPPELLAQFKNTRGPQKTPTKVAVSIRLSPDVLSHFKAKGPGWQSRIDEALRKAAKLKAG